MAKVTCPQCAEQIKSEARVCIHCRHQLTVDEIERNQRIGRLPGCFGVGFVIMGIVLISKCSSDSDKGPPSQMSLSDRAALATLAAEPKRELRLDRFSWEAEGDTYCHANAKVTNTGDVTLPFARMTMQFLKKGALKGSDTTYLDVDDLQPGQSSTWSAMYECPGNTKVEITATSRGNAVDVVDPPSKRQ